MRIYRSLNFKRDRSRFQEGKIVFIVAHGNSLRAPIMFLEDLDNHAIETVDVATGIPKLYEFSNDMKLIKAGYINEYQLSEKWQEQILMYRDLTKMR